MDIRTAQIRYDNRQPPEPHKPPDEESTLFLETMEWLEVKQLKKGVQRCQRPKKKSRRNT